MRLDPDVIERAAEAWIEAAKCAGKEAGSYEGISADEIIMQAIGKRYTRETARLYRTYEQAVVKRATERGWQRRPYKRGNPGTKGSTRPLSARERALIIEMLEDGVKPVEIAARIGRSFNVVYKVRRAVA